jgi:hypothetical protein
LSRATLVASVPDPVRQRKFLERVVGDEMSFRQARELLEENYQRTLNGAPFDTNAAYVMKGGGFSDGCATCPHRSGNMTAVNPDAAKNPNICTNVTCFERKKEIHAAHALAEAKHANEPIVDPKVYNQHSYNYTPPERICYETNGNKTWAELAKKAGVKPSVTVDEDEGVVKVFTPEQMQEIRKVNKLVTSSSGRSNSDRLADKKRREKEKAMRTVLGEAIPVILEKLVPKGKLDERLWPLLASEAYDRSSIDHHDFMAKRLGISKSMNESRDALTEHFEKHGSPGESAVLLVELLLLSGTGYSNYSAKQEWDERALETAKLAGIDLDKRLEKFEAEQKGAEKAKPKKGAKK